MAILRRYSIQGFKAPAGPPDGVVLNVIEGQVTLALGAFDEDLTLIMPLNPLLNFNVTFCYSGPDPLVNPGFVVGNLGYAPFPPVGWHFVGSSSNALDGNRLNYRITY